MWDFTGCNLMAENKISQLGVKLVKKAISDAL
jgi:hypothetical protein